MKIGIAQISSSVGAISSNEKKILQTIARAKKEKAHLLIFPEMVLSGYPPMDLIHQKHILKKIRHSLQTIHKKVPKDLTLLLGAVSYGVPPGNSAFLLQKNQPPRIFSKEYLADYDVFDEKRYFKKGQLKNNYFKLKGVLVQVLICEEIWQDPESLKTQKNHLIISLNASPFTIEKQKNRVKQARLWVKKYKSPLIYVNSISGEEELIFDGGSFAMDKKGNLSQCPFFKESLMFFNQTGSEKDDTLKLNPALEQNKETSLHIKTRLNQTGSEKDDTLKLNPALEQNKETSLHIKTRLNQTGSEKDDTLKLNPALKFPPISKQKRILDALTFGIKEFLEKNSFMRVHIGLSGGVDSALTAVLAHQALGKGKVKLFFLPGPFTSPLSKKCAYELSKKLNCPLFTQTIESYYSHFLKINSLNLNPSHPPADVTKQNIQSRLRSLFLMAYANNQPESLLLGTANKSELALGYSTLYGDLTGGLLPIGDLFKEEVYKLASYLKIPACILKRKPTAELKKNQTDEDDIPSYKVLDPILHRLIEKNQDPKSSLEKKIYLKILKSEFKRRQSPPILKIKDRSFGKGWRMPLSLKGFVK